MAVLSITLLGRRFARLVLVLVLITPPSKSIEAAAPLSTPPTALTTAALSARDPYFAPFNGWSQKAWPHARAILFSQAEVLSDKARAVVLAKISEREGLELTREKARELRESISSASHHLEALLSIFGAQIVAEVVGWIVLPVLGYVAVAYHLPHGPFWTFLISTGIRPLFTWAMATLLDAPSRLMVTLLSAPPVLGMFSVPAGIYRIHPDLAKLFTPSRSSRVLYARRRSKIRTAGYFRMAL